MRMWIVLFLIAFSPPLFAQGAGNVSQNSVNLFVCGDGTVDLLDFSELRLNGGVLNFDPSLKTYPEKIHDVLNRWAVVAPVRTKQYLDWLVDFQNDVKFYEGIYIPVASDVGEVAVPDGCQMRAVAFERPDSEILPGMSRYVVDQNLWNKLDETQRAGVVLHEIIYREAMKSKPANSEPTRYLTTFFPSQKPDGVTYAYVADNMPFDWVEYFGMQMPLYQGDIQNSTDAVFSATGIQQIAYATFITPLSQNMVAPDLTIKLAAAPSDRIMAYYNVPSENQNAYLLQLNTRDQMREIGLRGKFHFTFAKGVPVFGIRYMGIMDAGTDINGRPVPLEAQVTDPATSWFTTNAGEHVTNITSVASETIVTTNSVWKWDRSWMVWRKVSGAGAL